MTRSLTQTVAYTRIFGSALGVRLNDHRNTALRNFANTSAQVQRPRTLGSQDPHRWSRHPATAGWLARLLAPRPTPPEKKNIHRHHTPLNQTTCATTLHLDPRSAQMSDNRHHERQSPDLMNMKVGPEAGSSVSHPRRAPYMEALWFHGTTKKASWPCPKTCAAWWPTAFDQIQQANFRLAQAQVRSRALLVERNRARAFLRRRCAETSKCHDAAEVPGRSFPPHGGRTGLRTGVH